MFPVPDPDAESPAGEVPTNRTINTSVGSAVGHALIGLLNGRGDTPAYDDVVTNAHRAGVEIDAEADVLSQTEDPSESSGRG